jgi:exo-beta-1,3-glucanase (GH17 family)
MQFLRYALAPLLLAALAFALVACGGGGYLPSPVSVTDKRPLGTEFTSRRAASYSPFRTSRSEADLENEVITPANVLQDLRLVEASGIGLIRLFSSSGFGETVLSTIRSNNLDLKVMLGSYVTREDEAGNQRELAAQIDLANRYSDIVLAVSVGNEAMVDFSFLQIPPPQMARYISQVRAAVRQPVTTNDNWYFWAGAPKVITDVIDFAAVHSYPLLDTFYDPTLWDWRFGEVPPSQRAAAMMDGAIREARRQVGQVRNYFDRIGLTDLPIVVGEIGWTAVDYDGDPVLNFRASAINQKMFYDRLMAWEDENPVNRGPEKIIFFQSFDERWKGGDDGWGLFTRERTVRCVMQGADKPNSASYPYDRSQSCNEADALYFIPAEITPPLSDDISRYALLSDAPAVAGELRPTDQRFDAFGNPLGGVTADAPLVFGDAGPGDGTQAVRITPRPAGYGWGLLLHPSDPSVSVNLSGFSGGAISFWLKTNNYPGKLEIGIFTDTVDRTGAQAFLTIESGQYGYCNTNQWCQVSIPVAAFLAANPAIDLRLVNAGFVISDRFEFTGKPQGTTGLPPILVDGIVWVR